MQCSGVFLSVDYFVFEFCVSFPYKVMGPSQLTAFLCAIIATESLPVSSDMPRCLYAIFNS